MKYSAMDLKRGVDWEINELGQGVWSLIGEFSIICMDGWNVFLGILVLVVELKYDPHNNTFDHMRYQ